MTGHMVIYRGLPGSGKTDQAKKRSAATGGRIVGRDHIRAMLGIKGIGTSRQEDEVTTLQTRIIATGLFNGETVLVDDMNLRSQYVRRMITLANKYGATFEIVDLTNVGPALCHLRNKLRENTVPDEIIDNNYAKFIKGKSYPLPVEMTGAKLSKPAPDPYIPDITKPRAFLIDIDGTVALKGNRGIHDYDKVSVDLPNAGVVRLVRAAMSGGLGIPLFVSGRPDSCAPDTRSWLNKHVTFLGRLIMRPTGDRRDDFIVKRELFDKYIRHDYNVIVALDDRQQVVDMYRDLGITVAQVAEGLF